MNEVICMRLSKMLKQVAIFNSRGALLVAGDKSCILAPTRCLFCVQIDGNDETIETQYFCEDEN